jgi:FlaA1/EpsC-like NDP-sugar epimerase
MIELSGLKPHEDIKIEFSGVRPGEKLFEELSHKQENFVPTAHQKIFRFVSEPLRLEVIRKRLDSLRNQLHSKEANTLKLMLHDCVPEYSPWMGGDSGGARGVTAPGGSVTHEPPPGVVVGRS